MAEYTREQLVAGLQRAYQANDIESANEIANLLDKMDQAPREPYTAQNMAPSEIASGFAQDMAGVASRAGERMSGIMEQRARGEMSPLGVPLYAVGEVALPAATEAMTSVGRAGMRTASTLYPDIVEEPVVDAVRTTLDFIKSSDIYQTVSGFLENSLSDYEQYKAEAPENIKREIRAFESLVDIGLLAMPSSKRPPFEGKIGDVGAELSRMGRRQQITNRKEAIADMLEPTVLEKGEGKVTIEGVLRSKTYNPSPREAEIIDVASLVPDLKPNKTFTENYNVVDAEIGRVRERLDSRIRNQGNPPIDKDAVVSELGELVDSILDSDEFALGGGIPSFVSAIFNRAKTLIAESDGTTLGLLNVRRELDRWIENNSPATFTGDFVNSKKLANGLIRDLVNQKVGEAVPSVDVSGLLRKQHLLFDAKDQLFIKKELEARNAIGRLLTNVQRSLGVRTPLTPLGIYGTGGIAATLYASGFAQFLTGSAALGAAAYGATNILRSAQLKKTLGALLSATDKALKATKNDQMVKQLKADRAVLVSILQNYKTTRDEEEEQRPPLKGAANG